VKGAGQSFMVGLDTPPHPQHLSGLGLQHRHPSAMSAHARSHTLGWPVVVRTHPAGSQASCLTCMAPPPCSHSSDRESPAGLQSQVHKLTVHPHGETSDHIGVFITHHKHLKGNSHGSHHGRGEPAAGYPATPRTTASQLPRSRTITPSSHRSITALQRHITITALQRHITITALQGGTLHNASHHHHTSSSSSSPPPCQAGEHRQWVLQPGI